MQMKRITKVLSLVLTCMMLAALFTLPVAAANEGSDTAVPFGTEDLPAEQVAEQTAAPELTAAPEALNGSGSDLGAPTMSEESLDPTPGESAVAPRGTLPNTGKGPVWMVSLLVLGAALVASGCVAKKFSCKE